MLEKVTEHNYQKLVDADLETEASEEEEQKYETEPVVLEPNSLKFLMQPADPIPQAASGDVQSNKASVLGNSAKKKQEGDALSVHSQTNKKG